MSIFGRRHSKLTGDDVGSIIWKSVVDSAARLALVVTSDKEGRIVHQESDDSLWVLVDYTGPTYQELTSVGIAAVTSVAGEVGDVTVADMALVLDDITDIDLTGLADNYILKYDLGTATWKVEVDAGGGGGVTDHGLLDAPSLLDDDHPQYHTDARGDARYYTQGQVDTSLSGKSDTGHGHTLADVSDSGTAAALDAGIVDGTVPVLDAVGLPAVDGSQLTGVPGDVQTALDLKTDQVDFADHSARHENTGADEIDVTGLSGLLADGQTPLGHYTSHENGGGDEISVLGLSGLLADAQYSAIQDGGVPETDEGGIAHTLNFGSNLSVTGITSGVVTVTSVGGSDATAIHTDANNEISGVTEKGTPAGADIVVIEDSAASFVKKKVQLSNLPGGINVEEQSTPITGTPHSTLNFLGDTVEAADAGGGEATITVASFGTGAGTISEGDHDHAGVYSPTAHTHDELANVDGGTGGTDGKIVGRTTAGSGNSEELTATQVRTMINVEDGSVAAGTAGDAYATSHEADTSAHNAGEITNDSLVTGIYVDDALNTLDSDKASSSALSAHTSNATIHFTEASIDHTTITNIGTNSHTAIDDHINTVNDHLDWTADQGATNIDVNNVPQFAGSTEGLVPTSVGGTTNFLSAAGTWIAPSVGGAAALQINAQKASAGTITAGQAVYVTSYDAGAGVVEVELADASTAGTMPAYGIASSSIEQAVTGTVTVSGELTGQVTNGYSEGDALYISETAGALTDTKPQGTALVQQIGVVSYSHLSAGIIQVFGAGQYDEVPNIPEGQVWLGNSSGVAVATDMSLPNLGAGTLTDLNTVVADATLHTTHAGGDVTGGADLTIEPDAVTYAKMQNVVADNVLLGNNSGAGSVVDELTAAEVVTLLGNTHKDSVRVATTTAGTLASDFENTDTVDGVALATGDRILIKDQATASENGIYTVEASGAPTRATDLDTGASAAGMSVLIEVGTANASSYWHCTAVAGSDVVGTNDLPYELTGVPVDDVTIEIDATNGLQVKDGGVGLSMIGPGVLNDLDGILTDAGIGGTNDGELVLTLDDGAGGGKLPVMDGSNLTGVSSVAALDDLTDVTITAPTTGEILRYSGSAWVDTTLAYSDLADGTDGELITWDAAGAADTVAAGTSGQVLTSNGAGAAPTFQAAAPTGVTAEFGEWTQIADGGSPADGQWTVSAGNSDVDGSSATAIRINNDLADATNYSAVLNDIGAGNYLRIVDGTDYWIYRVTARSDSTAAGREYLVSYVTGSGTNPLPESGTQQFATWSGTGAGLIQLINSYRVVIDDVANQYTTYNNTYGFSYSIADNDIGGIPTSSAGLTRDWMGYQLPFGMTGVLVAGSVQGYMTSGTDQSIGLRLCKQAKNTTTSTVTNTEIEAGGGTFDSTGYSSQSFFPDSSTPALDEEMFGIVWYPTAAGTSRILNCTVSLTIATQAPA
jgi:hypothetical protein